MTAYRYRAISAGGDMVTGVMEAPNEAAVIERVRELGQYPVSASLATATRLAKFISRIGLPQRVPHRELSIAAQELATLIAAGLDLDRALGILERLGDLGSLRKSFGAVRTHVHDGASLADALDGESTFPKFFVSMVRAAELGGGTLDLTLRRLSEYLARSVAIREAVTSALVYPFVLLVTAGVSIIFILTFVLPEFRPLFSEAGQALPWPTRTMMAISDLIRGYWWTLPLLVLAGTLIVREFLKKAKVREWLDGRLLRLPVLGPLLAAIDVERFSRILGTLLSNGVPLPAALPLANAVVRNRVLACALSASAVGLREGDPFAHGLERAGVFPSVTIDLIRVGEESGTLDEMLLRQADLDEQRIRHTMNRLLAVLAPALTILLGLMVGALIASLLTAILSINDLALPK